jgi:hypothetical protein
LIEEDLNGTEARVRCGTVNRGRGSCRADWTDSNGVYCTGKFDIHTHGTVLDRYVEVSDLNLVICSTV